jgi:hypothetical protein
VTKPNWLTGRKFVQSVRSTICAGVGGFGLVHRQLGWRNISITLRTLNERYRRITTNSGCPGWDENDRVRQWPVRTQILARRAVLEVSAEKSSWRTHDIVDNWYSDARS